jgi:hypothetical protein
VERIKWAVEDLVGWRMWGEREKEEEGEDEERGGGGERVSSGSSALWWCGIHSGRL